MHYHLILSCAVVVVFQSVAPTNTIPVPAGVSKAFTTQYPKARLRSWRQKGNDYLASFRQDGRKCTAYYTSDGHWEATESPIKWTRNLPPPVRAAWIKCKYSDSDWVTFSMKKIEKPAQVLYSIHVGQVQRLGPDDADIGSEYILYFSVSGQLLKEERVPEPV